MLLRMLPDQVTSQWDVIAPAIEASLPPFVEGAEERMNNILEALMNGKMHCWVLTDDKDVYAIATTTFMTDPGTRTTNLFVYSLYGYKAVSIEMWKDGLDALAKWARKNVCTNIIAFTSVKRVVDVIQQAGGKADHALISLEVPQNGHL